MTIEDFVGANESALRGWWLLQRRSALVAWLYTATDAATAARQCPAGTDGTVFQREHANLAVVFYLTVAAEKTKAFWETVELTDDSSDTWLNEP